MVHSPLRDCHLPVGRLPNNRANARKSRTSQARTVAALQHGGSALTKALSRLLRLSRRVGRTVPAPLCRAHLGLHTHSPPPRLIRQVAAHQSLPRTAKFKHEAPHLSIVACQSHHLSLKGWQSSQRLSGLTRLEERFDELPLNNLQVGSGALVSQIRPSIF